jgi:predicted Zn-dependent protease with MMP-like domain
MPSGQPETQKDFEVAAQAIWDGLPEQFRAVLSNVTVQVADFADAETLKALHIPRIRMIYSGCIMAWDFRYAAFKR